jgi:hypothetical protein
MISFAREIVLYTSILFVFWGFKSLRLCCFRDIRVTKCAEGSWQEEQPRRSSTTFQEKASVQRLRKFSLQHCHCAVEVSS